MHIQLCGMVDDTCKSRTAQNNSQKVFSESPEKVDSDSQASMPVAGDAK